MTDEWDESGFGGAAKPNDANNNSEEKPAGTGFGGGFGFAKRDGSTGAPRGGGFGGGGDGGERRGGFGGGRGGGSGGFGERRGGGFGGGNRDGGEGGGFQRRDGSSGGFGGNREGGFGGGRGGGGGFGGERRGGFGGNRDGGEGGGFQRREGSTGGFGGNRDGGEGGGFGGGRGGGFGGGERRGGFGGNREGGEGGGFGGGRGGGSGGFGERRGGGFGGGNRDGGEGGGFQKRDGSSGGFGGNREGGEGGGFGGGRGGFGGDRRGGFGGNREGGESGGGRGGFGGGRGGGFGGGERRSGEGGEGGGFQRREGGGEGGAEGEAPKERYVPTEVEEKDLFDSYGVGVNFAKQNEIPASLTGTGSETILPIERFTDAKLSDLLLKNIQRSKYDTPTPVQRYSLPIILARRDLMACAQTGSGKTAAYILPIMTNILEDQVLSSGLMAVQQPQALVLSPTRELAIQIYNECRKFSLESIIKCGILYGGADSFHQQAQLNRGCNILVATPGRLLDVLEKGKVSLEKVKYFVLDEADRMLDMGFEKNVRDILTKGLVQQKGERCTFMFSATFPREIQVLAQDFLNDYLFLTVGVVGSANTDVTQTVYAVTRSTERTMVFTESKKQADFLALFLSQKGK